MDPCLRNAYLTFLAGLIILSIFIVIYHRVRITINNPWVYFGVFILSIVAIIMLGRLEFGPVKLLVAIAFLALLAYIIYPLIASLSTSDLWRFLLITAVYFIVLSIIAFTLPASTFASWGNVLFILLLLLVVFGVLGSWIFRNSTQFRLVFYVLILIIFGGLVLYDTYRISNFCQYSDSINSALSLILDAVNIFGGTAGVGTIA